MTTADPTDLTAEVNHHGGCYELAIELGDRDDARLGAALTAAWSEVDGCLRRVGWDPARFEPTPCTAEALVSSGHLHGVVNTPLGRTVCSAVAVREEDGGPDWLDLCLPLGALSELDPRIGGFPFEEGGESAALAWRRPLDDWLATVAGRVYAAARFRLALIGFEVSGRTYAADLGDDPPAERYVGYVLPDGGRTGYHPANA